MKTKLEQSMQEEQIRAALNAHWHASAVGDANAEHDIYDASGSCPQGSARRPFGDTKIHAGGILTVWFGCYQ